MCRGKRGVQCKGEGSAAPCCSHARAARMAPATDGVHRTRSDRDPASVARSAAQGQRLARCSKYSRPLTAVLSLPLFSHFLSLLNLACTGLSYSLRSEHICFFQNPAISVTIMRALLHQPIMDFPSEHQDSFTKENLCSKGGTAV
jgi:hypothetical protein